MKHHEELLEISGKGIGKNKEITENDIQNFRQNVEPNHSVKRKQY